MDYIFANLWRKREAGPVIPSTTDPKAAENQPPTRGDSNGSYAENIVYVSSEEKALRIATFHRCLSLLANTMAQLTPQYQQLNIAGGNYVEYNRGYWKTLNYLMQQEPNPQTSAYDLWQQAMIYVKVKGNALIYIKRDVFGMPESLWLATGGSYDPINDQYAMTFNYNAAKPWSMVADASDVIHFANTFKRNGSKMGIGTLEYARDLLTLSATLDQNALETSAKGGRVKLLIGEEKPTQGQGTLAFGMFNKEQMQNYAKEINRDIYTQDVVSIRGLDKVQNVSMTAADMQLFDQRQFGVAEICRIMDVPRTLAMDGSNSSYKTPEADRMDFLMNSIQPMRRMWENELNRKLIAPKDFGRARIHLCELPLMMFDSKGRAEIAKLRLESGTATINELRNEWDMPAIEGGDVPMASANLMTLDALIAKSQAEPGRPTTQEPPAKEGDGEE